MEGELGLDSEGELEPTSEDERFIDDTDARDRYEWPEDRGSSM